MKKNIINFLLVLLIGIISTIILTWPYVTKLSTYYKDSGDYSFDGTMLFYNQEALKSGKILNQAEYFNGYQFYPQPATLAYADNQLSNFLIFSPIYWISGNFILSVNLMVMITFILSFMTGFYLCFYFTKNYFASVMGGIVYAFNPQIFARFSLHTGLLSHYLLPLVFLFVYKYLKNPNWKNAFYFGLLFTLNSLSDVYFRLLAIIFVPVFTIPFIFVNLIQKNLSYFIKIVKYSLILLVFLPILLYFNTPYVEFSKNENAVRSIQESVYFSGRFINWFFSNPDSLIYGDFVKKYESVRNPGIDFDGKFNYAEHTLFLNIIPMLLFIIALIYFIKKIFQKKLKQENLLIVLSFFLVLIFSFILSLGPFFMGWNGEGPYIKMPFYYLYNLIFIMQGIRVVNRLQFIFYVPFSLLVAYGTLFLTSKIKSNKLLYFFSAVLIFLLFLENVHIRQYDDKSSVIPGINDNQLSFLKDKKVLHLPIHIPELGENDTYTLNWFILTKSISLNGYSGYAPPDQLSFLIKLKEKLGEGELKQLKSIDTDYILIHKDLLGSEKVKYEPNFDLYRKGLIYEDDKLMVIDLSKFNFEIKFCDFEKDIEKNISKATIRNIQGEFYALILKNNSDCYYPSIYDNKYKELKFKTNFLGLSEHIAKYRLPVVISPKEQVILSEPANNLRIE